MSIECGECERDLRGGHSMSCTKNRSRTFQSMVAEWHERFGVSAAESPTIQPKAVSDLRIALIEEEFTELKDAISANNLVAIADAICDLHYVISGTAVSYGIPETACFQEVHRSNMSKIWPDGTIHHREDGKVLKPPSYSRANLIDLIYGD